MPLLKSIDERNDVAGAADIEAANGAEAGGGDVGAAESAGEVGSSSSSGGVGMS